MWPRTSKVISVGEWRRRELLRAGLSREAAAAVAARRDFDVHAVIELVERGCPPPLAVRIAAPLEPEA